MKMSLFRPFLALTLTTLLVAPLGLAEQEEATTDEVETTDEAETEPLKVPYVETIIVTASRTEQKLIDAPVSMTVITADQIAASPADNFGDLLRGIPGLNGVQISGRDINFNTRGASGRLANRELALVDGRSLYLDFFGLVMWDLLPVNMDEIEQIEVQRGPGSAMWGANALTGVINVRTKSPRDLPGGMFTLATGENGTRAASVRLAQAKDKISYRISASYYEQDAWERDDTLPDGSPLPPGTDFANEGTEQPKLDVRVDYEADNGGVWSYRAGYAGAAGLLHSGIGPFSLDDDFSMSTAEVGYEGAHFDAKVYWNHLSGDGVNLLNGVPSLTTTDTFVADVTDRRVIGKQVLVYGASARYNDFEMSVAPGENSRSDFGVFGEDHIQVGRKVRITVGARVDYFDTIGTTVAPRTSLIFKPAPRQAIRFAYNRAYRAPTLLENFADVAIPNAIVLDPMLPPFVFTIQSDGNRDLDEEVVDAFEIGYTAELSDEVTFTAAIYRSEINDNISFFPTAFFSPADPPPGWPLPPALVPPNTLPKSFGFVNVSEVRDQGIELAVRAALGPRTSLRASYTFQDEPEVTNDNPALPLTVNEPPSHQGALSLDVRGERWYGSFGVTFTDEAFWADVLDARFWGTTGDYTLVDAAVALRMPNIRSELALDVVNLFNEDVKQHIFGDIFRRRSTLTWRTRF